MEHVSQATMMLLLPFLTLSLPPGSAGVHHPRARRRCPGAADSPEKKPGPPVRSAPGRRWCLRAPGAAASAAGVAVREETVMTGRTGRVVVVGAGPAGMALAYLLARRGVGVTVLEAHADFARAFRGEGLQRSGIDAL